MGNNDNVLTTLETNMHVTALFDTDWDLLYGYWKDEVWRVTGGYLFIWGGFHANT